MLRSEFFMAVAVASIFNELAPLIDPKPNLRNPNFEKCWSWTGGVTKGATRNIKKRDKESWNFVDRTIQDRPYHYLPPFERIDPRRALFELYKPSKGITTYTLKPRCGNPLCCNPEHQEYSTFTMHNDDTVRRYATYFTPESPFFEHRLGTFNPKRIQFQKEMPKTEENRDPPPPLQRKDFNFAPTPIKTPNPISSPKSESIPNIIKNGLGQVQELGSYYEKDLSELEYNPKFHWMSATDKPVPAGIIEKWLMRFGTTIPAGHFETINAFGVGCVEDAFKEIEKPANLTELLRLENFNFHPKLVLTWYSSLSDEDKTKIDMTK